MNVADWSDENLRHFGEYEAFVVEGQVWSNVAIHDQSCRLAGGLVELGLSPGERVLMVLPHGIPCLAASAGILRSGGVMVQAHSGSAPTEIERIARDCAPAFVVTTADVASRSLAGTRVRHVLAFGAAGSHTTDWISAEDQLAGSVPLESSVPRSATDEAAVCYTSGTTGLPRGVVFTHGGIDANVRRVSRVPRPKQSVELRALPPTAFGGSALFNRFVLQQKVVLVNQFDPEGFLREIERHRVTELVLVPSMAEALVEHSSLGRHDHSSLRRIVLSGAHVSVALAERIEAAFGVRPIIVYGATEAGGAIASTALGAKPGSVGRPLRGVEVRVCDDAGAALPCGDVGEIYVKTPWKPRGQPDGAGTAPPLAGTGWTRTGDRGYVDANSELFLVGRSNDAIIQSGFNVHPQEVADVVLGAQGVRECAVVGLPNRFLGEEVVACVVRSIGAQVSEDEIKALCRMRLDPRKVPCQVLFFDALPKNHVGKTKAHELRDTIVKARAAVAETAVVRRVRAAPAHERRALLRQVVEQRISRIVGSAVGGSRATLDEPTFSQLGVTSLGAAELASGLSEELGRPISATLVFTHPTVGAVCDHLLNELCGAPAPPSRPLRHRPVAPGEPLAIVGLACRLPGGADSADRFWSLLRRGVDATSDITCWETDPVYDPVRGSRGKTYTRRAALLASPDEFDAEFFGISPREARALDPQHRLLLEVTWEAIEHAGYDPRSLSKTLAGLFVGISGPAYASADPIGGQPSMAAGRVAHFLDLRGPAMSVDTACSSSLVAIHSAVQSLRHGECDVALAGGVKVIGSMRSFVALCQIQVLAGDGRCKAFDASADGFGRGEGCVMIVLKRLADAHADRDAIVAVIRGSAINHDGRSASLTAPSGRAQEAVIRAALDDAGVAPADVDYLEAHGTGTPLGDPIEVQAALSVFGERERPLVLGSVKTNVGHLEAAAGAVGLIKAALALHHGEIPPHLHLHELSPILAPLSARIDIPRELRAWPASAERRRVAGVTSMGMSGTNAHVVLQDAPPHGASRAATESATHLLCVSARSGAALDELRRAYADHLEGVSPSSFADTCFTASAGRAHFAHRMAVLAKTPDAARALLLADPPASAAVVRGHARRRPKVAFLFTGQGSQYGGMGRELYETHSVFRRALNHCAEILQPLLPRPLLDILDIDDAAGSEGAARLDETVFTQPALFAIEWSVCELWRAWGIEPDLVLGHSLGENVAAAVAGVLTLEDALTLTAARGRLMHALGPGGAMMAVAADSSRVGRAIAGRAGVQLAAVNGPQSTVISGEERAVSEVAASLQAEGVRCRRLVVSAAFHSARMDPMLDAFEAEAARMTYAPPRIGLVSTLTGKVATLDELSRPAYWRRHVREPVQFFDGMESLVREGAEVFLEVGPNPVLLGMGRSCVAERAEDFEWLPSLRSDRGNRDQLLESLGRLYARGVDPNWAEVYGALEVRRVRLPTYRFQHTSYWDPANSRRSTGGSVARSDSAQGAAAGTSAPAPAARELLEHETIEGRRDGLVSHLRTLLAEALGVVAASLPPDESLLERGLDSLRVMQVLTDVRRSLGITATPDDLFSHPTIASFALHLSARMGEAAAATAPRSPASDISPLVTLHAGGTLPPLFCMHPAGGQVSAYLRLRTLLGDAQPLFALQSRGCVNPALEHASLEAMARDYASVILATRPTGPYRLLGWSMGGLVAHAVAGVLEGAGARVERVGMIDVPAPGRGAAVADTALLLAGIIYEMNPRPPSAAVVAREIARLSSLSDQGPLLIRCEESGLLPPGAVDPARFDAMARLYRRHAQLVREHRPGCVRAPLALWWAESGAQGREWASRTTAGATSTVVGGTHFTIVRPPWIEAIAAALCEPVLAGVQASAG